MSEIIPSAPISGTRTLGKQDQSQFKVNKAKEKDKKDPSLENTTVQKTGSVSDETTEKAESSPVEPKAQVSRKPDSAEFSNTSKEEAIDQVGAVENYSQKIIDGLNTEIERLKQEKAQLADEATQLKTQLNATQQEGKKAGFEEGYKEGQQKAELELQTKAKEFESIYALFTNGIDSQIQSLDQLSAEIGFTALLRIVKDRLGEEKFVLAAVQEAVSRVREAVEITIHVSPRDLELIENNKDVLNSTLASDRIKIIADKRVALGGCIIETDNGSWDARLETQLQLLKETLVMANKKVNKFSNS